MIIITGHLSVGWEFASLETGIQTYYHASVPIDIYRSTTYLCLLNRSSYCPATSFPYTLPLFNMHALGGSPNLRLPSTYIILLLYFLVRLTMVGTRYVFLRL